MKKQFNIHEWQANQIKQRLFEKEGVKHYTKDGKEWKGATHKMPGGPLMTQDPHTEDSEELFHKEDLKEQGFDGRFKDAMSGAGFSDDEQDDIMSRDIGNLHGNKASDLIDKLRGDYRGMSDDELDDFSVEMINHFLDNIAAQAAAKVFFGKKGL